MLVVQHGDTQSPQFRHPGVGSGIVLVISGDEVDALPRAQGGQRSHVLAQLPDRTVDKVAGDRYYVWLELVHLLHDAVEKSATQSRSDVDVGDLHDLQSFEPASQ